MSHNKLYRNFIILQEDERGHSAENEKALSGYAKVEAKGDKCKISFYAQNLRKEDNYSMVLICCKRDFKELIDLGTLTINEVGKGDTSKEYYINNIAGLGVSYEKISGAAICKASGNDLNFIMHGFMNGEEPTENWRKFKLVRVESKREDVVLEPKKIESKREDVVLEPKKIESKREDAVLEPKKIESKKEDVVLDPKKVELKKDDVALESKNIDGNIINTNEKIINSKADDISNSERNENIKVETVEVLESTEKTNTEIERIEEKIAENILSSDERHKCNKCDKEEDKKEKYKKGECKKETCKKEEYKKDEEHKKECKKCNKEELKKGECKKESLEEIIDNLCAKIEDCNHIIDLDIHDINCDYMVYGFIKKKYDNKCEWKKFKLNRSKGDMYCKTHINKRIEENTKLDLDLDTPDFDKYERDIKESVDTSKDFSINGSAGEYFEKIARGFDVYDNKLNDINNCKWYRVNVGSIDDLCNESNYNKYTLAYYPMINYYPYISKNNHFLLGYKCDTEGELQYILYAIPGSKEKEDQPYGGKTGFVTWTNSNNRDQGYWIMFYDFKNSSIVVPMKK